MTNADSLFMAGFACGVAFTVATEAVFSLIFDAVDALRRRRRPHAKTPDPHGNEAENGDPP